MAGTQEAVNSQNLARTHLQRHVVIGAAVGELLEFQDNLFLLVTVKWNLVEIALFKLGMTRADHAINHPALIHGGATLSRNDPTIAEHRHPIADGQHVVEKVRY